MSDKKNKAIYQARSNRPSEPLIDRAQLALKASLNDTKNTPTYSALLENLDREFDLAKQELECARLFNFELPEDILMAVDALESTVKRLTKTKKAVILLYNEEHGTYTCLSDEKNLQTMPRELTKISDGFLQELLGSDQFLHTFLFVGDTLVGILAVAEKPKQKPFDAIDEVILELVAQYLAPKLMGFAHLKRSLSENFVHRVVMQVSNHLITALDQESVLSLILNTFSTQLGFQLCQYVAADPQTGEGYVLVESLNGDLKTFIHAGLQQKRRVIQNFASMVSLFSSAGRHEPFLYISGDKLGDKPLTEVFHIKQKSCHPQSVLMIPVEDPITGKLQGTFNFFQTGEAPPMSGEIFEIIREIVTLINLTLSRTKVLEKAMELASTDELTGLSNRRAYYERFEAEIERSRRHPASLSVAMIDVDHFKKLNDTFGHINGDLVLQELADLLKKGTRKSDVVCRFGGEEFALLLPDTTFEAAQELMERLRKQVEKKRILGVNGEVIPLTISIGLAQVATSQALTAPTLEVISNALASADRQLYQAKSCGRNQVCARC